MTFQLSQRNKLNLFWDEQISSDSISQGSSTASPETGGWNHGFQRVQQAKWTSTTTNKLLLEAGVGTYLSNWNTRETPGNDRRLIQVTEQCPAATGCAEQRRHLRPDLPRPEHLERGLDRGAHLERRGVVCHRRPQHEVRLPGRVSRRQSRARRQQHVVTGSPTACRTS